MLTNEGITKLFNDNFALASYAIRVAQRHIKAGEEFTLTSILAEIKHNPVDLDLKEIPEREKEEEEQTEK